MTNVLIITASVNGDSSKSRALAESYVKGLEAKGTTVELRTEDLASDQPPHVDGAFVGAMYTPEAQRSSEQQELLTRSDGYVANLKWADLVLIASPMYNFSVPSTLKAYIDHVARVGVTFQYSESGPQGLLTGKKAIILGSRGGAYGPDSPVAFMNHQDTYLRTVLGFIGITNVETVIAERLASGEEGFEAAKAQLPGLLAA
ncbi:FMN-dependent NADH-azoreductase [Rhodovibrionaceae bacterium A322]